MGEMYIDQRNNIGVVVKMMLFLFPTKKKIKK
jgi:hypothetical protein